MPSKNPSFSPETTSQPDNPTRRQFLRVFGIAGAITAISGCAGLFKNVINNVSDIDSKTKLTLLSEVKFPGETDAPPFADESHQPDDSWVNFGIGPLEETVEKLKKRNRAEMVRAGIKLSEMDEVETVFSEKVIDDNRSIVCVRTKRKVQTKMTSVQNHSGNTARTTPYLDLDKQLGERIPNIPARKVQIEKAPEQNYTSIGGFKEKLQSTVSMIEKHRISHLYNRYIVKRLRLQNKDIPEDKFEITLDISDSGRVKMIRFKGVSRKLRKLRFHQTIKNYAKRWVFPRNPEAKDYSVSIPIELKAPAPEFEKK